jgi:hypothetical protein
VNKLTLPSMKQFFELILSVLGIAAVALLAVEYFFHTPIFYNPSNELAARFNERVIPLVLITDQGSNGMNDAIEKNDAAAFAEAVQAFVLEKGLQGQLINAIEASEAVIKCHQSNFCLINDYDTPYEQPIRRLWYTYRSVVQRLRGHLIPASFGAVLENEAKRILKHDREIGKLPS